MKSTMNSIKKKRIGSMHTSFRHWRFATLIAAATILLAACPLMGPEDSAGPSGPGAAAADLQQPANQQDYDGVVNLVALAGNEQATVSWIDPPDSTVEAVEITWEPGGGSATVGPGVRQYTATGLSNGTTYTFTVVAVDSGGNPSTAATVPSTPLDTIGPAPVTGLIVEAGISEVSLSWVDPADTDLSHVEVSWTPGGDTPVEVPKGAGAYTASGLENDTEYTFTVVAADTSDNLSDAYTGRATPQEAPTAPVLATEDDTGHSDGDAVTSVTTGLTLSGTGMAPGRIVELRDPDDTVLATATADSDGAWTADLDLADGTYEIAAHGVEGTEVTTVSAPFTLTVDATAPAEAPNLLKPSVGDNTGVELRPRFMWENPADAEFIELQAATDPTFAGAQYTWVAPADRSFRPDTDMTVATTVPVGSRYYLRLRAVDLAGNTGPWSDDTGGSAPHRYVNVGRFDGDFNGDGYADVLGGDAFSNTQSNVGEEHGTVYLYYGGSSIDASADITIHGPVNGSQAQAVRLGRGVSYVGDVDGDGYQDFVAGVMDADGGGKAYLFLGGADRQFSSLADADAVFDNPNTSINRFGSAVSAAGDINADGRDDFLIGSYFGVTSPQQGGYPSLVALYLGGESVSSTPHATMEVDNSGSYPSGYINDFTIHPGRAGDLNGDGFADFVIGRPDYDGSGSDRGRAEIYFGGATIPTSLAPDVTFTGTTNTEHLGAAAYGAGDVNNDGYDDLIFGTADGEARLYFGTAAFSPASPDVVFHKPTISDKFTDRFGRDIAPLGDFNGDGIDDLVIGDHGFTGSTSGYGAWALYYGRTGWPNTVDSVDHWAQGNFQGHHLGDTVGGAGDVNGDGRTDMLVGGWGTGGSAGRVHLFFGEARTRGYDRRILPSGNVNFSMGLGRAW
mgnify:CR=1 FL=1